MTTRRAPQRASIYTLGCRLNQAESGLLEARLREAGYELVPFGEAAELGIVHSCTVTHEADAKSRKALKRFIRSNPHAFTAVIGCYSQIGYKALAQIEGLDLIIGNEKKLSLLDYVGMGKNTAPLVVRAPRSSETFSIEPMGCEPLRKRANLKVQDGCDFMCSYCVIPHARGRARSRDFANLVTEAQALAERGARELVLTGVNIGTYNHEGRGVPEIVDALDAIPGLARVRISSLEPGAIAEALFERMADPSHALTPYLHIPAQSGSDAVLERMRRRYTRREFLEFIKRADAAVPDLCIGTDLLVGMPGETDAEFAETVSLLRDSPIAYAHVFKYSGRRNTPAARMPGKVSPQTMQRRSAILRELSEAKRGAFHAHFLGRTFEVLFEQCEGGLWTGYTGNYIRAAARSPKEKEEWTNRIASVHLEACLDEWVQGTFDVANLCHTAPSH